MVMSDDRPALTDYTDDGVDLTLVRAMLILTPAQRLEVLDDHAGDILSIRERNAGNQKAV